LCAFNKLTKGEIIYMRNILLLFMGVLIVFLSGCATVPMATLELDKKAKDFSTLPDKGSVFIFNNSNLGTDAQLISVNGKTVGSIAALTYFRFNLIPGKYSINSFASYGNSTINLNVEAGTNYFVWLHITLFNAKLEQVNETEGREGVLESKLIASTISDDQLNAADSNAENSPSVSQKLRDLESLRKDGVITEDEYENKKKEFLKSL
jgi:hypothetical protein